MKELKQGIVITVLTFCFIQACVNWVVNGDQETRIEQLERSNRVLHATADLQHDKIRRLQGYGN